jgi:hypothetical protein
LLPAIVDLLLEIEGVLSTSHIDGQLMVYYPSNHRRIKVFMSFTLISAMIATVIGMVRSIV